MKRILKNAEIKKQIKELTKYRNSFTVVVGAYTFEGDNGNEQSVEINIDGEYIGITELELQDEEYKINGNLKLETGKIITYLSKHFENVKSEYATSY